MRREEGFSHGVGTKKDKIPFCYHENSKVMPKTKTLKIRKRNQLFRDLDVNNKRITCQSGTLESRDWVGWQLGDC